MKVGIRTPSPTRSVKARTTGRVKRAVKKSVNPVYGKKGVGLIKDPERAIYNKIYHKVTVDPLDPIKHPDSTNEYEEEPKRKRNAWAIICCFCIAFTCFGFSYYMDHVVGDFMALPVILGGLFLVIGIWKF